MSDIPRPPGHKPEENYNLYFEYSFDRLGWTFHRIHYPLNQELHECVLFVEQRFEDDPFIRDQLKRLQSWSLPFEERCIYPSVNRKYLRAFYRTQYTPEVQHVLKRMRLRLQYLHENTLKLVNTRLVLALVGISEQDTRVKQLFDHFKTSPQG